MKSAAAQSDKPLKVDNLILPFSIRDNKAGYEAFPKRLEANYRAQVALIVPADRKMIRTSKKSGVKQSRLSRSNQGVRILHVVGFAESGRASANFGQDT